ncbi:hypothetical protein GW17_00020834 [Ensete ventricosum]|nr:hypothetical protein GW17_00020834 [Ensete ventricosum]
MLEADSPWAMLRIRLEMLGVKSPWATLRARLEMFGTESPWARLRARSEMLDFKIPWARLRARSEMLGTKSPWARLRARSEMLGSTTILSSSGGTAPANSGATEALAVIQSCFNIDSTMTTRRLVEVRKNYYIAPEYELHVPLPGECPYDTFPSDFSLSTDALEAGLRFPLHPVIEACLEGWQISPSQMAPNL